MIRRILVVVISLFEIGAGGSLKQQSTASQSPGSLFDRAAKIEPGAAAAGLRLGVSNREVPADEEPGAVLGLPIGDDVIGIVYYRDVEIYARKGTIVGILVKDKYTGAYEKWLRIGARLTESPVPLVRVSRKWLKPEKLDGVYVSEFDVASENPTGTIRRVLITTDARLADGA